MAWISLSQAGQDKSLSVFYTLNLPTAAKYRLGGICMARINGSGLT